MHTVLTAIVFLPLIGALIAGASQNGSTLVSIPAAPLMHGTGMIIAISTLVRGGTVVTVPGDNFDPELAVTTCAALGCDYAVIVGDAFGRPLLRALGDAPAQGRRALPPRAPAGAAWSRREGALRRAAVMISVTNSLLPITSPSVQ